MTTEELITEVEACTSKINAIGEEVRNESDLGVILSKIAEMTELRRQAYLLLEEWRKDVYSNYL